MKPAAATVHAAGPWPARVRSPHPAAPSTNGGMIQAHPHLTIVVFIKNQHPTCLYRISLNRALKRIFSRNLQGGKAFRRTLRSAIRVEPGISPFLIGVMNRPAVDGNPQAIMHPGLQPDKIASLLSGCADQINRRLRVAAAQPAGTPVSGSERMQCKGLHILTERRKADLHCITKINTGKRDNAHEFTGEHVLAQLVRQHKPLHMPWY